MDMPIIPDVCVDLNCMSQSDCRAAFRFDQEEMKRTVCLLPFPDIIITKQRDRVHLSEAYTIFCRRHFDGVICTKSLDNLQVPYQEFSGLCYIWLFQGSIRRWFYILLSNSVMTSICSASYERERIPSSELSQWLTQKKLMSCRPTHYQGSQYDQHKKAWSQVSDIGRAGWFRHQLCSRLWWQTRWWLHLSPFQSGKRLALASNRKQLQKICRLGLPYIKLDIFNAQKATGTRAAARQTGFQCYIQSYANLCWVGIREGSQTLSIHRLQKANKNGNGANGSNVARCILAYKCCHLHKRRQPNLRVLWAITTDTWSVPEKDSRTVVSQHRVMWSLSMTLSNLLHYSDDGRIPHAFSIKIGRTRSNAFEQFCLSLYRGPGPGYVDRFRATYRSWASIYFTTLCYRYRPPHCELVLRTHPVWCDPYWLKTLAQVVRLPLAGVAVVTAAIVAFTSWTRFLPALLWTTSQSFLLSTVRDQIQIEWVVFAFSYYSLSVVAPLIFPTTALVVISSPGSVFRDHNVSVRDRPGITRQRKCRLCYPPIL